MTMADRAPNSDLARQLQARLRALRAAGIECLPPVEPLRIAPAAATVPDDAFAQPALPGLDPPVAVEIPLEQRRIGLQQLAAEVRGCTRCPELCSTRTQTVFGDGELGAELCFIGEAPGEDEDRQGVPFVGAAGQL